MELIPENLFKQTLRSRRVDTAVDPFFCFTSAISFLLDVTKGLPSDDPVNDSLVPNPLQINRISTESLQSINVLFSVDNFFDTGSRLQFQTDTAAFMMSYGSVIPQFVVKTSITILGWLIVVTTPKWLVNLVRSPEAASKDLVENTRRTASKHSSNKLTRIDHTWEMKCELDSRNSQHFVILLHGLFSTDLGTFDDFINRFHYRYRNSGIRLVFVGWPHSTLTSIAENGSRLADYLIEYFSGRDATFSIVAHSRGGLVARATLDALAHDNPSVYSKMRILLTLGTPHEGSALAENVGRYLGTYFLLCRAAGNVASVYDVLAVMSARDATGLEDLAPTEATAKGSPRSYLSGLFERERGTLELRQSAGIVYILIGGQLGGPTLANWRQRGAWLYARKQLSSRFHDLVVSKRSTTSERLRPNERIVLNCDHFSYASMFGQMNGMTVRKLTAVYEAFDRVLIDRDRARVSTDRGREDPMAMVDQQLKHPAGASGAE